jgi:septal ring factor EnvC (AmiA/AmiB activator)
MPGEPPKPAPATPAEEGEDGEKKVDPVDSGQKVVDPAKPERPEPVNFKALKELRKKAETERDTFKAERDALAAKVADLEPRSSTFESERKALQDELQEKNKTLAEREAALWRSSAKESPQWKEKAEAIRSAARAVDGILELPQIKDAELKHSVETLLNPANRAALNETIRTLHDAGLSVEANDLMEAHRAVNVWRGELRRIEEQQIEDAKAWSENREGLLARTFSAVRAQVAKSGPIHDERSAEFLALAEEDRKLLNGHHETARAVAAKAVGLRPEELAAQTYVQTLEVRLRAQAQDMMSKRIAVLEKELEEHKGKLSAYERAAGGGGSVGGSRIAAPGDPANAEDEAAMLDPRNMAGYKGM